LSDAKNITEKNLARAFPDKTDEEIRRIARLVFINQGKNAFELFSFPKLTKAKILGLVKIENEAELRRPIESGKGIIMPSAHCGNWEIMGASFASLGLPVNVVARRIYIDQLNNRKVRRLSFGRVKTRQG
jgi:KDO2-lipid IV(A) lauroyltransferase